MAFDDDGTYRLSPIQGVCVPSRQISGRADIRGGRGFDEVLARGVRAVIGACFSHPGRTSLPDVHATMEGDTLVGTFSTRNRLPGVVDLRGEPAFLLWHGRFVGWRVD